MITRNYPVIYALAIPADADIQGARSDVSGEKLLKDGATAAMIKTILVPDEQVGAVQEHLQRHEAPDTIKVGPFFIFLAGPAIPARPAGHDGSIGASGIARANGLAINAIDQSPR